MSVNGLSTVYESKELEKFVLVRLTYSFSSVMNLYDEIDISDFNMYFYIALLSEFDCV